MVLQTSAIIKALATSDALEWTLIRVYKDVTMKGASPTSLPTTYWTFKWHFTSVKTSMDFNGVR
jgi:hypothetical protein